MKKYKLNLTDFDVMNELTSELSLINNNLLNLIILFSAC